MRLQAVRASVLLDPNTTIPEDIYRMRDLMHKNEYKDRVSREKGAPPASGRELAGGPGHQLNARHSQQYPESSSHEEEEEEEEHQPGDLGGFTGSLGAFPQPFPGGMLPQGWPMFSDDMLLGQPAAPPPMLPPIGPAAATAPTEHVTRAMLEQVRVGPDSDAARCGCAMFCPCIPCPGPLILTPLPLPLLCRCTPCPRPRRRRRSTSVCARSSTCARSTASAAGPIGS